MAGEINQRPQALARVALRPLSVISARRLLMCVRSVCRRWPLFVERIDIPKW